MIGSDSGSTLAISTMQGREMYPRRDMVQARWVYPVGQAERVRKPLPGDGNRPASP
jgi:hypothetical protein